MSTRSFPSISHGLGFLHGSPSSITTEANTAPRRDGLFQPLTRFLRKPTNALERLVDDLRSLSSSTPIDKEIEERKSLLKLTLISASSLVEWQAAASELDGLEGNNAWKDDDWSAEYNSELIRARLNDLEDARISCDAKRMLFLIRTSLSRHLGGMGSLQLYKHSHIGTKRLIERYINVALDTLSSLLDINRGPHHATVDSRTVLEQVVAARQSFGRSALLLSGGGTFGMNHIGVVKCLWEARLLPRIVSGASAGSIVCAVLCTRKDDEIPKMLEEFCYGALDVFSKEDEVDSVWTHVVRFLKTGALFDISNLTRVMKGLLGDMTFQEAYNRTRRILNIPVSSAGVFELPRLLNYITAPNVIIWSAVAASCSVPLVFTPADLLAKDPRTGNPVRWNPSPQLLIDGSVDNDLPMTRLSEMFNVNHFIVSQVNPHVVPFLPKDEKTRVLDPTDDQVPFEAGPGWINKLASLAKDEVMHRMLTLSEFGIFPNLLTKTRSVLSQRYSGDITILPEVPYSQVPRVLQNPNAEFMMQATLYGERATWPKLSRIQNHCAIELALDDAVQALRARVAFSPSQVDLRLNVISRPGSRAGSETRRSRNRKKIRFSENTIPKTLSLVQPNMGRPVSFHEESSAYPVRIFKTSSEGNPVQERRLPEPRNLRLDVSDTPPMFSTGSEDDDDKSSSQSPAPTSESDSSSEDEADYFSRLSRDQPRQLQLFPHSSQPATPLYNSRRSYFGSSSPTPSTSIAPLSNLSMTPSASFVRQQNSRS